MTDLRAARFDLPGGFALVYRTPIAGWVLEGPSGTTFFTYSDAFARDFAAAMSAEPAALGDGFGGGLERYRHKQRGTSYAVVGAAAVQAATGPVEEGDAVVVYQSEEDGQLWVRRAAEFHDGRFERVGEPPGEE